MQQNNLPQRGFPDRLMLVGYDADVRKNFIDAASCGKLLFVDTPTPVISRDGGNVRISKQWAKIRKQTTILKCRPRAQLTLAAQIFRENNGFRQLSHGTPQAPALVA